MGHGGATLKEALSNDRYRGSPIAWKILLVLGLLNLFRGSIHFFADDGGAGRIAGIDLTHSREVIVFLFAVMGLEQLVTAAVDLSIALRYRALVPALLAIHLIRQAGAVIILWLYKGLPVAAPGKYGALVVLPIIAFALFASLRSRAADTQKGKKNSHF